MTDPVKLYAQLVATFNQGDWQGAQLLVTRLLPFASQHAGVFNIAGMVSLELRDMTQAVSYLRRATELDSERADFAIMHAKALSMSHFPGEALAEADRAMALLPRDPMALDALGMIYVQNHAQERAITVFRQAVAHAPTHAAYRFNLATSLIAMDDIIAAEKELEACIGLDFMFWDAHLSLAQLRRQTPESNHLERLQRLLTQHKRSNTASICLNMALAKEYEDLGEYPRAFEHLIQGKAAGRVARPYSIHRDEVLFQTLMQSFPTPQAMSTSGDPTGEPIFIMGMPRSGTTLVERILSSHPDVHAAGELQNFAAALQQESKSRRPYLLDPDMGNHILSIDWQKLGARYLASISLATAGRPRFIDKMPHNFLYAGFIANALPHARIICMRRNPLDTCLGNFRQLFAHPSIHLDYTFDLLDTGRYFVLFDQLMAHWKRAFPGRIHEVNYETLVGSQEACSRELLAYCGLAWNDACLHFEKNPSPVATLSSQQVRKPVFHTSVGRWKHYERELSDLRKLLRDAGFIEA